MYDNTHLPIPDQVEELQSEVMKSMNVSKPMQLYYWFIIEVVIIFAAYLITRLVTLSLSSAEMIMHHVITVAMKNPTRVKHTMGDEDVDSQQELYDGGMNLTTRNSLTKIAKGKIIFIVYLLVELIFFLVWFGLSVNALIIQSERQKLAGAETSNVMCEFNLSKLGNNQKYVTQCQMPLMGNLAMVSMANSALCVTVAVLLLIHLLYTALIAPFLSKGPMDSVVRQVGVQPLSAAFSDLTLLAMLHESIPY